MDRIATVTFSEIMTALNKAEAFVLAIAQVANGFAPEPKYVRQLFQKTPDFAATSVNYKLSDLLVQAEAPR